MNKIKKKYLKLTDREKFYEYVNSEKNKKSLQEYYEFFQGELQHIQKNIAGKKSLNFKHSGHLGDLVYSLPIVKELSATHECNFYINVNEQLDFYYHKHPAKNVLINDKMADMLLPLIESQPYIHTVKTLENEPVDIDLDLFRRLPMDLNFHSNRWYFQLTSIQADIENPYLFAQKKEDFSKYISVVRTFRARSQFINYDFLKEYPNILFIGLPDEYEDFKKSVPNAEYYNPKDFKELAEVIYSSRFFIGNQSFTYALAEAMKAPRILEGFPEFPVVHPIGSNGKDAFFQDYFEKIVGEYDTRF